MPANYIDLFDFISLNGPLGYNHLKKNAFYKTVLHLKKSSHCQIFEKQQMICY